MTTAREIAQAARPVQMWGVALRLALFPVAAVAIVVGMVLTVALLLAPFLIGFALLGEATMGGAITVAMAGVCTWMFGVGAWQLAGEWVVIIRRRRALRIDVRPATGEG
jgi:hypothetical protein